MRSRLVPAALLLAAQVGRAEEPAPGEPGAPGLAIRSSKVLTVGLEGPAHLDNAVVLVRDGKIEAVGSQTRLPVPDDYAQLDVGDDWLMPGMIDLHSHVGGSMDINDMVYQTNPGLRVYSAVIPRNPRLEVALAAGITTVLFIPGSGTNISGAGILVKTGHDEYERCVVRAPGSLKIAQGDNPVRWGYGMARTGMAYHIRSSLEKGRAYAARWRAFEEGRGPEPERDIRLDIYRDLFAKRMQVSTHTQYYQLVLTTLTLLRGEFGIDVYIDHGSFDSYLTGEMAERMGVAAILGPRELMWPRPPRFDTDGRALASAWGFQQAGLERIGFNTDAPVVAQEQLPLQAAMGARYGMDDRKMAVVRAVTIVPAVVAGIADRVGSLEPGKDADILVVSGHPADPRSSIEAVLVDGRRVYDAEEGRVW